MSAVPGDSPYGPKSWGQILDRTLRLLRANLKLFLGISAVPPVIFFLVFLIPLGVFLPHLSRMPKTLSPAQQSQLFMIVFPTIAAGVLLHWVALAPSWAAATIAALRADLGTQTTFREAYAQAFQKFGRCLLLLFLIGLITVGPILVIQLIVVGTGALLRHASAAAGFAAVGTVLLAFAVIFVYVILAMLRLSLAFSASFAENLSAVAAIKRSYRLTRGAMGRIVLTLLIVYAIVYAVYLVALFALMFLGGIIVFIGSLSGFHEPFAVKAVAIGFLALVLFSIVILVMALNAAGYGTALAVLYNDQRIRIDGPTPAPAG